MPKDPRNQSKLRRQLMHAGIYSPLSKELLNREIREDPLLGENYELGHSFFLPKGDNFAGLDRNW